MNWLVELAGAAMVVCACGYTGFRLGARYEQRHQQLRDLSTGLSALETEIGYGLQPLGPALERSGGKMRTAAAQLLRGLAAGLQDESLSTQRAWQPVREEAWTGTALKADDVSILDDLVVELGKSGRSEQVRHLRLARERLQAAASEAADEARTTGRMCRYLGVLAGLMLAVVAY